MRDRAVGGRISKPYAWLVVALRPVVVVAWIAAAVAAVLFLPSLGSSSTAPLGDIVPADAEALAAQERALRLFGATVATDTMVVDHDPGGLGERAMRGQLAVAAAVAQRRAPPALEGVRLAVPLVNVPVRGAPWGERNTTAVTYLFLAPDLNLLERQQAARAYARHLPAPAAGSTRGITGPGPARLAQFQAIDDVLTWVELATVLVIVAVVAMSFRSILAPLITLATGAIAYVCAVRVLAWSGEQLDARPPSEIEPVLVVLLLGLVTNYTVFFMVECRRRLAEGDGRLPAARSATARIAPIVLVAGTLVAAGTASLLAGTMEFFQVFGPGMALCALVATVVCVTLVPALLGLLGPRLFGRRLPEPAGAPGSVRRFFARWLTARPVAWLIGLACVAALVVAAAGARTAELGVSFIPSLSPETEVRRAADAAGRGFVAGVLSPTDIVVEQPGIGSRTSELARLEELIARQPGVATVLGPAQTLPAPADRFLITQTGSAARFVVLLADEPTGATAIGNFQRLEDRMPALARQAGLPAGARLAFGGDTALSAETVETLVGDLWRIGAATAAVMFLLLAVFLRALVAPLLLLIGGALAFAGSFGLTSLLLPHILGTSEFTYYVPLVAAVLLVGVGSDYNVFVAGRIRDETRRRSLRASIAVAVPSASRAVTIAGLTLASTFALLALVPLRPFRELALLLAIGVLIDALFVRPVLVPAMIAAVGRRAWWPGRQGRGPAGRGSDGAEEVDAALRPPPEPQAAPARDHPAPAGQPRGGV